MQATPGEGPGRTVTNVSKSLKILGAHEPGQHSRHQDGATSTQEGRASRTLGQSPAVSTRHVAEASPGCREEAPALTTQTPAFLPGSPRGWLLRRKPLPQGPPSSASRTPARCAAPSGPSQPSRALSPQSREVGSAVQWARAWLHVP